MEKTEEVATHQRCLMKSLNFVIHAKILTIIANVVMLRMKGFLNNDCGIRVFNQEIL